jgi:RNA polymerase sigma-70 factor (family 1)
VRSGGEEFLILLPQIDEEILLKVAQDRAKNNDFKQLFLEMYPRLVRYAVSLLGDGNEARDVVGDVFEKAWNQFSSLQMETRRSWLYASVRNACLNWLKHQQVEQTNVEALIEATRYDMSTRYEEHERLLQQAEQIARELKEPTCTILRLCYFEHLTYQQAADRLGISPNTVKKHISKALAILRERMKHTNIEN